MGFIDDIIAKAKSDRKTIVLPESTDPRVIEAGSRVMKEGVADVIMIGTEEASRNAAPELDLTGIRFIDPASSEFYATYCDQYYEMRKKRGMTPEKAKEVMLEPTAFGMMLVKDGRADGLVAGAVNSTADTLRPALQILRTKPGTKLVSAFFMMIVPDCEYGANGTFLFADSGLNEDPDEAALAEIAISSADSFRMLVGEEPIIAMTSYSTKGSAKSPLTEKMIEATRLAQEKAPDLKIDGELQIDAAIVPSVAASKAPGSAVAGKANVFIFPNLDTGNIAYKLVERLAKAEAYGPLLQGIARPVNDLSRGCSADDIVGVCAITAVQAQEA